MAIRSGCWKNKSKKTRAFTRRVIARVFVCRGKYFRTWLFITFLVNQKTVSIKLWCFCFEGVIWGRNDRKTWKNVVSLWLDRQWDVLEKLLSGFINNILTSWWSLIKEKWSSLSYLNKVIFHVLFRLRLYNKAIVVELIGSKNGNFCL